MSLRNLHNTAVIGSADGEGGGVGERLGLSYSQYCSLNTSHGTDGGEIILQSKSFSVGHYPLHSREINL